MIIICPEKFLILMIEKIYTWPLKMFKKISQKQESLQER